MANGFEHPKVSLHIGDGFEFIKNHPSEFDVIITDSSDPIGKSIVYCNIFYDNDFLFSFNRTSCFTLSRELFSITSSSVETRRHCLLSRRKCVVS